MNGRLTAITPFSPPMPELATRGVELQTALCPEAHTSDADTLERVQRLLALLQLQDHVQIESACVNGRSTFSFALTDAAFEAWTPGFDTLSIHARLVGMPMTMSPICDAKWPWRCW